MNRFRKINSELHENQEEQYESNQGEIVFVEVELTARELEVLQLASEGKTNTQIGELLNISGRTVRGHMEKIMRKLHARNRAEDILNPVK